MDNFNVRMTSKLRQLLKKKPVFAATCFDPLSARLAELAGFDAIHLSGGCFEMVTLGFPDLGFTTLTELASGSARMTEAVNIPILADIDTGFGGVLNITRTIREMERAGIAGVHIEDQCMPKHCPLIGGRKVISREEAIDHIKAACAARKDPDFIIVARTDSDIISFNEVLERSNLYLEAGADMVMPMILNVDGKSYHDFTPDEQMDLLRRLAREIKGPIMTMGFDPPKGYTADDLGEAGASFIMFASAPLAAAANALDALYKEMKKTGTPAGFVEANPGPYHDSLSLMRKIRLDDYVELEKHFCSTL